MPYLWSQSMRSRQFAVLAAAVPLSVFAAGCGKKATPTPAPTPVTPTTGDLGNIHRSDGSSPDGTSTSPSGSGTGKHHKSTDSIATVASHDSDLTNFTTALGAANLTSQLGQPGPYTVFAPNNDGFAKLGTQLDTLLQPNSQDQLANILKFHIVSGKYTIKHLKNGELLTTLQGTRLRVSKKNGQVKIGNSTGTGNVVESDLEGSNGVIQVIDTVLTPKKK